MSTNNTYTTEDIRRYLEGGLSSADMHAIERAALDDPFLADAIEGMRELNNQEKFAADTAELKKRLAERATERKVPHVIPMLWKAAAVLVIVLTGVAIIIFTGESNTNDKAELAKAEERSAAAIAPQKQTVDSGVSAQMLADTPAKTSGDQSAISSTSRAPVPKIPRSASEGEARRAGSQPKALADKVVPAPVTANIERAEQEESLDAEPSKKEAAPDTVSKSLQGRVAGIVTDEVVVVGYGASKNRNKTKSSIASGSLQRRIEPEGGWIAFENYINNNKAPDQLDSNITGTEQVSFMVDGDGRPSSVNILKSLSPSHDKEVIRLINDGPRWTVLRGKKRKVTLVITF